MKLKFQLVKFERGLSMQILEQSELFWNKDASMKVTFECEETNLKIVSNHLPKFNLDENELHLRGAQEENNYDIPATIFTDNDQRDQWYEYILNAIQIWARSCAYFEADNDGKAPILKRKGNIFEI